MVYSSNFKIGDILYLKGGSPPLTVMGFEKVQELNRIACGWFNGTQFQMLSFAEDCVTNIKPTAFFCSINFN